MHVKFLPYICNAENSLCFKWQYVIPEVKSTDRTFRSVCCSGCRQLHQHSVHEEQVRFPVFGGGERCIGVCLSYYSFIFCLI